MDIVYIWVISSLILFIFYYIQGANMTDFKAITNRNLQMYMLSATSLAFFLNFVHVYMLRNAPEKNNIVLALITFFSIQVFFIPAVRSGDAACVKRLLLCACVPIYYLVQLSIKRQNTTEIIIGTLVLTHVFINDFLLYGHMFAQVESTSLSTA